MKSMITKIDHALFHALDSLENSRVKEAMNYSLQAEGKRLRPLFVLEACRACKGDIEKAMPVAVAIEMIHTYSLIHDDLPAMDNDDYRRGRLTCHRYFDEATAILAGDGLLTEAFNQIAKSYLLDQQKMQCVRVLAQCAGSSGMILGQCLDMESETKKTIQLEELEQIHYNKTGKLFAASLQLGCIVAKKSEYLSLMEELGLTIGIAFQIQDDILDATQSQEKLGKSNSDHANHKMTYVSLLGLEKAQFCMEQKYAEVSQLLEKLPVHNSELEKIIERLKERIK